MMMRDAMVIMVRRHDGDDGDDDVYDDDDETDHYDEGCHGDHGEEAGLLCLPHRAQA